MNRMVSKGFTQQVNSKQNLKQTRNGAVKTPGGGVGQGVSKERVQQASGKALGNARVCMHKSKSPEWPAQKEEGESNRR